MGVHESVHTCQFSASRVGISMTAVTVSVTIIALVPFVAIFLPHEGIRVLFEYLADFGLTLQILLQGRMVLHENTVIDQRRIFTELLRDFPLPVPVPIYACQFSAGRVAISTVTVTVSVTVIALVPFVAIFLSHEGVRV